MHSLLFHLLSAGDGNDAEGILNLDTAEMFIEFAYVRLWKIYAHSVFVNWCKLEQTQPSAVEWKHGWR